LTELALTGITTFSDIPLRVWGLIGFIISLTSLIYAVYFLTKTLIFGADLPGFPSIIVAVMFLGGVQLLSIGILGEYIARIFTEVKQRPKYLIGQQHGFE
jgi:glycosyltransferase involved in cell wall biosynthesis